jgi:hypothetical protein
MRRCEKHECEPGTEVWREAMAAVLGIDRSDDPDVDEKDLDEEQICPMCMLDARDKAKESPRSATETQCRALSRELHDVRMWSAEDRSAMEEVCRFIREATGKDPMALKEEIEKKRKVDVSAPGGLQYAQSATLANIIPNLLHEAVQARVRAKLGKG